MLLFFWLLVVEQTGSFGKSKHPLITVLFVSEKKPLTTRPSEPSSPKGALIFFENFFARILKKAGFHITFLRLNNTITH